MTLHDTVNAVPCTRHYLGVRRLRLFVAIAVGIAPLAVQAQPLWTTYGPRLAPFGTRALAIDPTLPTILYAGTSSAGIFKSTDGGSTWMEANNGLSLAALIVEALAIDPTTPTTLYAGTYAGVYRSTDGAGHWQPANSGMSGTGLIITALALDPTPPATLYAGTGADGVYASVNAGASWNAVNTGLGNRTINTLTVSPTSPTILYAGTLGGIYRSATRGDTWSPASAGVAPDAEDVLVLAVHPTNPTTLYAGTYGSPGESYGTVYVTTDGGSSWRVAGAGLDGVQVSALAIDPTTPTTLCAGTRGSGLGDDPHGIFISTNGGATWIAANTGLRSDGLFVFALAVVPTSPSTLYAATAGGVYDSRRLQGATCVHASDCPASNCVDGVCCDAGCTETCQSCASAETGLSNGTCAPVLTGLWTSNGCTPGGPTCNGSSGSASCAAPTPTSIPTPTPTPVYLIDTGSSDAGPYYYLLPARSDCSPQPLCQLPSFIAAQFTLPEAAVIDSVEAWLGLGQAGSVDVKIRADLEGLPATTPPPLLSPDSIFSKTVVLPFRSDNRWVPVPFDQGEDCTPICTVLAAGTYWLTFEPVAESGFSAVVSGGAPYHLPKYAVWASNVTGTVMGYYAIDPNPGFGIRIAGSAFPGLAFGTGTRTIVMARPPGLESLPYVNDVIRAGTRDFASLEVEGDALTVSYDFGLVSIGWAAHARGKLVENGLSAGAYAYTPIPVASLDDPGVSAARGIAFRTCVNMSDVAKTVRVEATLHGAFNVNHGNATAGIYVLDSHRFTDTVTASGVGAVEYLLRRDSAAELSRGDATLSLASLFPQDAVRASKFVVPDYPTGEIGMTPLSTGFLTIEPGEAVTVLFDVSVYAHGANVNFSDTLAPAPALFTDLDGNPVPEVVAVGPSALAAAPTASLVLVPEAATTALGTIASIIATATTDAGVPVVDASVSFSILSGPSAGLTRSVSTDSDGRAIFAYTAAGVGTDAIQASLDTLQSNTAEASWMAPAATLTPLAPSTATPTVTVSLGGTATATPPAIPTPTATSPGTPTQTPRSTLTLTPPAPITPIACGGDCDGLGTVTVDELVRGVNIALGTVVIDACRAFDVDGDDKVTVDELVKAVNYALNGCPVDATATPMQSPPSLTATPLATPSPMPGVTSAHGPFAGFPRALLVDPEDSQILYVATEGGGVFKSTDGGATWRSKSAGGLENQGVQTLAFDPTTSRTLYAGLFPHRAAASRGVYKSTDGGESWRLKADIAFGIEVLVVDPMTPETVYAGTNAGIYKSTDGGEHWEPKNNGLTVQVVNALVLNPIAPNTLYAGTSFGGMFKSTDGANTWVPMSTGITGSIVSALAIDPTAPQTLYAGTEAGTFKSVNGGSNWTRLQAAPSGAQALVVDLTNAQTVYAYCIAPTQLYQGIFKSTDGGGHWVAMNDGLTDLETPGLSVLAGTRPITLAMDPRATQTLYAGTAGGGVFKSNDGGEHWAAKNQGIANASVQALALDSAHGRLYAGTLVSTAI